MINWSLSHDRRSLLEEAVISHDVEQPKLPPGFRT
jgi:hypothetical protein